ncbi:MAG TPA: hypothetical protein VFV52_18070 [Bacilli bacterium]|nr:hypothetical protein [Bacilli bacterium]
MKKWALALAIAAAVAVGFSGHASQQAYPHNADPIEVMVLS